MFFLQFNVESISNNQKRKSNGTEKSKDDFVYHKPFKHVSHFTLMFFIIKIASLPKQAMKRDIKLPMIRIISPG